MSEIAGAVRDPLRICDAYEKTRSAIVEIADTVRIKGEEELYSLYLYVDMLYARLATLAAMADFANAAHGGSRGSALYLNADGIAPAKGLETLSYTEAPDLSGSVQEAVLDKDECDIRVSWRARRPLPCEDGFFENVWKEYRQNGGVVRREAD